MRQGKRAMVAVAIAVFGLFLFAGCGTAATQTTSTTTSVPQPTTSQPAETTTVTSAEVGPQQLPSGRLVGPGVYVTTDFEPTTVMYRIEGNHSLRGFQHPRATGIENYFNWQVFNEGEQPYTGIAVHGLWHSLSPEEIIEELEDIEPLDLGQRTGAEVGGFAGQRIEGSVKRRAVLWSVFRFGEEADLSQWLLQPGPLDIILLETPAGTLLITIIAPEDEWDEFLSVAEQILDGISFPDLE